ncbi:hypothetical protein BDY24DRAFT_175890 [Mrakia frigida]|uniref:uncharacterized protein n=1 Tax=Mrakia frigida TaxID=29902 RepID=UPI003FCC1CA4
MGLEGNGEEEEDNKGRKKGGEREEREMGVVRGGERVETTERPRRMIPASLVAQASLVPSSPFEGGPGVEENGGGRGEKRQETKKKKSSVSRALQPSLLLSSFTPQPSRVASSLVTPSPSTNRSKPKSSSALQTSPPPPGSDSYPSHHIPTSISQRNAPPSRPFFLKKKLETAARKEGSTSSKTKRGATGSPPSNASNPRSHPSSILKEPGLAAQPDLLSMSMNEVSSTSSLPSTPPPPRPRRPSFIIPDSNPPPSKVLLQNTQTKPKRSSKQPPPHLTAKAQVVEPGSRKKQNDLSSSTAARLLRWKAKPKFLRAIPKAGGPTISFASTSVPKELSSSTTTTPTTALRFGVVPPNPLPSAIFAPPPSPPEFLIKSKMSKRDWWILRKTALKVPTSSSSSWRKRFGKEQGLGRSRTMRAGIAPPPALSSIRTPSFQLSSVKHQQQQPQRPKNQSHVKNARFPSPPPHLRRLLPIPPPPPSASPFASALLKIRSSPSGSYRVQGLNDTLAWTPRIRRTKTNEPRVKSFVGVDVLRLVPGSSRKKEEPDATRLSLPLSPPRPVVPSFTLPLRSPPIFIRWTRAPRPPTPTPASSFLGQPRSNQLPSQSARPFPPRPLPSFLIPTAAPANPNQPKRIRLRPPIPPPPLPLPKPIHQIPSSLNASPSLNPFVHQPLAKPKKKNRPHFLTHTPSKKLLKLITEISFATNSELVPPPPPPPAIMRPEQRFGVPKLKTKEDEGRLSLMEWKVLWEIGEVGMKEVVSVSGKAETKKTLKPTVVTGTEREDQPLPSPSLLPLRTQAAQPPPIVNSAPRTTGTRVAPTRHVANPFKDAPPMPKLEVGMLKKGGKVVETRAKPPPPTFLTQKPTASSLIGEDEEIFTQLPLATATSGPRPLGQLRRSAPRARAGPSSSFALHTLLPRNLGKSTQPSPSNEGNVVDCGLSSQINNVAPERFSTLSSSSSSSPPLRASPKIVQSEPPKTSRPKKIIRTAAPYSAGAPPVSGVFALLVRRALRARD